MEYRFLGNSGFRVPVLGFGIGRDYEWELMPLGLDQGMGAVVWSPLGGGWN